MIYLDLGWLQSISALDSGIDCADFDKIQIGPYLMRPRYVDLKLMVSMVDSLPKHIYSAIYFRFEIALNKLQKMSGTFEAIKNFFNTSNLIFWHIYVMLFVL